MVNQDIKEGDWVKVMYDKNHRPFHDARYDGYPYFIYGGIVRGLRSNRPSRFLHHPGTTVGLFLEGMNGYIIPEAVVEHYRFECECGKPRPHDDYACKECKDV